MARNKYPEETRKLIIDTAARLFIEQGYDHTSVQDIINHLGGLSKGAIYHHFNSKEEILMAVADTLYSGTDVRLNNICRQKDLNGAEKLRELFKVSIFDPAQKEILTVAPDMLNNPQFLVMYLRDNIQKEGQGLVLDIIEEGIKDGSIETEYPEELAEVVMLLGGFWLNPMIYHRESESMMQKVRFYQHLMKCLGLDIIDQEMLGKLEEYARIYEDSLQ